jgi:hypothetical protein
MPSPDNSSRRIIAAYSEQAPPPMFLMGFFKTPPQNIHNSEKIEIDIERDDEEIAIVIQDLSVGARQNEMGKYVAKAFTPPIFDEEGNLNAFNLIKRMAGENPYADVNFQAHAIVQSFGLMRRLNNKVSRAVELECAQVLQTGIITLRDPAGNALYILDFQARSSHFVTPGTAWSADGMTGDPFGDIGSLSSTIRTHGRRNPKSVIMGSAASARFQANAKVKAQMANFGQQKLQDFNPQTRNTDGATFLGRFWIQNYWFDVWTYDAGYRDPQTGNYVTYLDPYKVIILAEDGRLDLSFGAIPRLASPEQRVLPFLPERMTNGSKAIDVSTFAWITPDAKHLKLSVGTRPLAIPTAIDTFGCLTIGP